MVDTQILDPEAVLGGMQDDAPTMPPLEKEPRTPKPTVKRASSLERRLTEMFANMGAGIMFLDPVCGKVVADQAPSLAEAFDNLAKENERIKKWLEAMLVGGAWGGVLQASFPIFFTVAAHHGMLRPEIAAALGIEVPMKPRKEDDSWGGPEKGESAMEDAIPIG